MSFEFNAPDQAVLGAPIVFSFSSPTRVSGRVRLTSGNDAVSFCLQKEGGDRSAAAPGHRVRGKSGNYAISDWGDHEVGSELVLRFEGRKAWLKVTAP